ncbi:hypothetical protein FIBSPDRAFT_970844 [Athelia psychrophila]|uniref:Uncharacterized protein n=1 Tax=Athelia psychrophila TaxID=1759441 RepID=A0A167SH83_9AGAM|nr:hypothetical protein FIBSPDRAFT_970844 [Fibularhizoctonia sp. CBS 109695]
MSSVTEVTDANASAPSSPRAWSIHNQQGDRDLYPSLSPALDSDAVRATEGFVNVEAWMDPSTQDSCKSSTSRVATGERGAQTGNNIREFEPEHNSVQIKEKVVWGNISLEVTVTVGGSLKRKRTSEEVLKVELESHIGLERDTPVKRGKVV